MTVKIADFRRFLFPLWRHLRWVWLARNAARPELLSRQIVLGRPLIFADFGGHDLPSFSERRPKRQLAVAVLGSSPRGIGLAWPRQPSREYRDLHHVALGRSASKAKKHSRL
jgi:hypothetical protein